ncbi:MAG: hypothetical protein M3Z85_05920, partial [Acidobacteriota bacterium]|nr:hypothetical protein [Acidobacteriota bacterium]
MPGEPIVSIALLLAAGVAGRLGSSALGRLETAAGRAGQRRRLTIVLAALLPAAIRLALLPVLPVPVPQAHDEFSYLLAADTFVHGRLANPALPVPDFFESIHILVRPSYASIYPPAQGFVLAIGKLTTGSAWAGVLLSVAIMTASVCWMLQGWVSPSLALVGTGLLILRLDVFSYWTNSYWGGAVAASGGALILGALPRLAERRSVTGSILLGTGIAILANSRPFEGAVFTALASCLALYKFRRMAILWPAIAIPLLTVAFIGYYSFRITGHPLLPPYLLYRGTTAIAPHFTFLAPRSVPAHWDYAVLRDFYLSEMHDYEMARARPVLTALANAQVYWRFYIGVLFSLPLVAAFRDRRARLLIGLLAAFFLIALAPQVWHSPHYAAPATGLVFLIITLGMNCLRGCTVWRRRIGPWLTRTLVMASVIFMLRVGGVHAARDPGSRWSGWANRAGGFDREPVLLQLASGGRHLIVVRYGPRHD